jgi:hypothetical protein
MHQWLSAEWAVAPDARCALAGRALKLRFARDSPLEGDGFEPSVPRRGKPFSRPFWAGDRRFWLQEADIAHLIETDLIPPAAEIGTFAVVKAITAATG